MFDDLDWPLNVLLGFVSISWASCLSLPLNIFAVLCVWLSVIVIKHLNTRENISGSAGAVWKSEWDLTLPSDIVSTDRPKRLYARNMMPVASSNRPGLCTEWMRCRHCQRREGVVAYYQRAGLMPVRYNGERIGRLVWLTGSVVYGQESALSSLTVSTLSLQHDIVCVCVCVCVCVWSGHAADYI